MKSWFSSDRLLRARLFVFFSVLLLLKSYVAWTILFDNGPSWSTLLKELPVIWIVFCLIEWFSSKRKLAVYLWVNLFFTLLFFSIIMYYKYYGVIATYHSLKQVNQVTAVKKSVLKLVDPYYLPIFMDIVVFGILMFRKKTKMVWNSISSVRISKKAVAIMFTASVLLALLDVLPNRASLNEHVKAEQMGILNYEFYTLFKKDEIELADPSELTQSRINELKKLQPASESPAYWGAAKGRNLIIIQMESFQSFLIDYKVGGKEVTPNLNRLVRNHFYFPNFYQQVGQGNTSDAEFITNTSYYIPPRGPASQEYADKVLPSLPRLLENQGYSTQTFHTNVVEFWNRGELYSALGFQRYYDQAFFGADDAIAFGSSDEILYDKTVEELKKIEQRRDGKPFYAQLISMSAHHPFDLPPEKNRMQMPEKYQDNIVGDYLRSQNYADYALGKFIDDLKEKGLWDNSLIVLYGDHRGVPMNQLDHEEKKLMLEIFGHEYNYKDMINVPLIIAAPGVTEPKTFPQIGGQVDTMPTIANLLGISLDYYLHFGQDLLNNTSNLIPQRYYLPSGSFLSDSSLFLSGSGFQDGTQFPLLNENGEVATEEDFARALKLLNLSDSYVLQLPDRVQKE
ncbi:LTA synthase family protein [Paenibacillus koleovorans]|uniref:LTA synthase family protein n=1 Tax=Paenibacillus koleovorans TaxID=121608 RepID=UPI000FDC9F58|nr:LTA synthase family protein [Paenibacillus koleovorans]